MQEVHSDKNCEKIFKSEWGGEIIFAHGDSKSRGCAILFNPSLKFELGKCNVDTDGRFAMADVCIDQKEINIVCIYALNKDDPDFFMNVFEKMNEQKHGNKIIGGDFNLVLDEKLDSVNRKNNNKKAQNALVQLMNEFMIVDPWCERNKEKFEFTWYTKRPREIYARLDYVLVNYAPMSGVNQIKNIPSYRSDHNAVKIHVDLNRGFK